MANDFDSKWLEGITFKTAESRPVEENGKKVTKNLPVERPATAEDVLSWKDNGAEVGIVMKDGRKYSVSKDRKGKANDKGNK